MATKKQARSEKRLKNLSKQKAKYPLLLKKIIEISDIILEVIDARFGKEMQNKEISKIIQEKNKKIIYVLNKSDLTLKRDKKLRPSVFVSCKNKTGISGLRDKIKIEAEKIKKEGAYNRVQVGVVGYPNSGKSSLINLLIGKNSAKIGSEAGFTKGIQKLKLTKGIILLDSPGVIPLEHYSTTNQDKITQFIKFGGKSYNQIKEPEIVLNNIIKDNKKAFEKFYKIKFEDAEELINKIGIKKGFLKKGGEIDSDRTARSILKNWQLGVIKS